MKTTADLFSPGDRRGDGANERLRSAWSAFAEGRASKTDYDLIIGDLAEFSGFFYVTPGGAEDRVLQRAEGRREVFARILFLVDVPIATLGDMQRAALTELAVSQTEGER